MKKLSAFLIAIAIIFSFGACTKNEKKVYKADPTADALIAGLSFGDTLEKSTADAAYSLYSIDPTLCVNAAIYVGSGATADEVAVFNCTDPLAAEYVLESVNARIDYLREGYSDYGPDQVPKIDSAAVITSGSTVILCVCENPEDVNDVLESVE